MDGHRFDELAKVFAAGASRRRILKVLGGSLAGGVLVLAGRGEGDAFLCRDRHVLCAKDAQCCSGNCVTYHCACPVGQTDCGLTCADTTTDVNNCGGCGHICLTAPAHGTPTCSGGVCGFACESGFKPCGSACIPDANCCTDSDCTGGKTCQSGTCACPSGQHVCNGSCVDTSSDPTNCGTCGVTCESCQTCSGGTCQDNCPVGQTCCPCGVGCATIGTAANCDCFGPCEAGFVCTGTQCCTPDHSVCQIREC